MKVKSITAKEIFRRFPEVKLKLWGGNFWASGFMQIRMDNMETKILSRNTLRIKEKK